jgi:hypothetical protein
MRARGIFGIGGKPAAPATTARREKQTRENAGGVKYLNENENGGWRRS